MWRSLPRPRDLVYLCNACVLTATNRRHARIEEADILSAEEDYSRFALDALRVEGSPSEDLDNVLLEFAGAEPTLSLSEVTTLLERVTAGMTPNEAVSRLLRANFLGLEVREDVFEYPVGDQGEKKAWVLANRLPGRLGREARVSIHPAFRPYLEVLDDISR